MTTAPSAASDTSLRWNWSPVAVHGASPALPQSSAPRLLTRCIATSRPEPVDCVQPTIAPPSPSGATAMSNCVNVAPGVSRTPFANQRGTPCASRRCA